MNSYSKDSFVPSSRHFSQKMTIIMEENLPAQHRMLLYNQNIQQNYGIIIKLKAGLYTAKNYWSCNKLLMF
jgi:hypothetical protein